MEFGGSLVQEAFAEIRNISVTGRKNRLYGGILLISAGFAANLYFFFGGELPDFLPYHQPLTAAMVFGFFTAGCLVLLESTTQVCVYHGFRGTHESSSGGKKHADDSVAAACRSKSWVIIVQSVVLGVFSTAVSIWIIA